MSLRLTRNLLALCAVAIIAGVSSAAAKSPLIVLGANTKPLAKQFNASSDRFRFLAIMSPT